MLRRRAAATELAGVRAAVRAALSAADIEGEIVHDLVLAASEASGNVVRHAYAGAPGTLEVEMTVRSEAVDLVVRDEGRWCEAAEDGRHGLGIMHAAMDSVEVERGGPGTTVRMRKDR